MVEGIFKYEDDLLKHHVRMKAWLPVCKKRLETIRKTGNPKRPRRLKYFTFCAVGAVDVLMLDVARVIRPTKRRGFDSVFFFDRTPQHVIETQRRIPGAIGFPGDFVKVVLLEDPDEELILDGGDVLVSPQDSFDKAQVRERQLMLSQRQRFISCFPFDVINLDLEEFLFKPNDPLPGRMINAFRKVFEWQRKPLPQPYNEALDGFSLMFTTQVGPPNISKDYITMLQENLDSNISNHENLKSLLVQRTGVDSVSVLKNGDFDSFFKLAMPKVIAHTLMEEDWYIDPDMGISIFEFERPSESGPYKMLHLVMDIKRKKPPRDRRAPGMDSLEAMSAYQEVVHQIFAKEEIVVTEDSINKPKLLKNLDYIKGRRKKYYPDDESLDRA